jgi:hypothetical protein
VAIKLLAYPAIVSCSNYTHSSDVYYFAKERLKKCSYYLRKNINYDGSFSLEEFRKVVNEKKVFQEKSRRKRKEIVRLRRTLVEAQ